MTSREDVYAAIDSERAFQESIWNSQTTTSNGDHELEAWCFYIERYLRVANEVLSTKPKQVADAEATHVMRKIAALAVKAMEQHGAPKREGF